VEAGIPTSFGIDMVEVVLDLDPEGCPSAVEFSGSPGAEARFVIQIWRLSATGEGSNIRPMGEMVSQFPAGQVAYLQTRDDPARYDGLGLVITRLDAREDMDGEGSYTIRLGPAGEAGSLATGLLR
jgi:hypothetical protein